MERLAFKTLDTTFSKAAVSVSEKNLGHNCKKKVAGRVTKASEKSYGCQLQYTSTVISPFKRQLAKALSGSESDGDGSSTSRQSSRFDVVSWFRESWAYIQGLGGSVLVLVFPGEVLADDVKLDCLLQDVSIMHRLGIKVVLVPGTHQQIDKLLVERGIQPKFHGAYRVTDPEALEAAMEASGRIRVHIEARLSRRPSIPALRRHVDSGRRHNVGISVASGNFVFAKRRGVVGGLDFGYTGEVKNVDVERIKDRLDSGCVVLLSNLGFTPTGEVLNCNTYEVATACAIALQADKLVCILDGSIKDENGRTLKWMNVTQADALIRQRASLSLIAKDYVRAVAGEDFARSLGIDLTTSMRPLGRAEKGVNGHFGNKEEESDGWSRDKGFPIGGEERLTNANGFLSELVAAVYACRAGIPRVHLLDSAINGSLLLELYTREGVGTMISSDLYEGTRPARLDDLSGIRGLLEPLERSGVLVQRTKAQLEKDLEHFIVVEQDNHIIACAALIPFPAQGMAEVAAIAVSPGSRGKGRGDRLLGYLEQRALELGIDILFLLTTRTADWFVQRGFSPCDLSELPKERLERIDKSRNSMAFMKYVQDVEMLQFSEEQNEQGYF